MRVAALAFVVGLALLGPAGAATTSTPGVTATTVLLGSTGPLAEPGGVLRGAEAYFKYVNARGGVNGRRIVFRFHDDGGDPAQAAQDARRLIQDDQVLALFSTVGTRGSLAVRPVANAAKVPQLFAAAPASVLGREYRRFPYTLGYTPTGSAVGQAFARYVLATAAARAKVGVLYEDDEEGRDLLAGLEKGLGAGKGKIVATAPVDPAATDVEAGVAELQASGANTLMVFVPGAHATQAYQSAARLGWKPRFYVGDAASTPPEGSISSAFARDIASPVFGDDPGASLARAIVRRYLPAGNPRDASLVAGMASAFTMVDVLRRAGRSPTRESLLRAATTLAEANNPFLLPGIVVRTTPTTRFPIAQVRLQLRHAGRWQPLGGLVSVKP